MSYLETVRRFESFDFETAFLKVTSGQVERALANPEKSEADLIALLSPAAESYLEPMARAAYAETRKHFGRAILLYAPLYLADFCTNSCVYCGFNHKNMLKRSKLGPEEIVSNAKAIAAKGIRHLLILTGEAPSQTPPEYILEAVRLLRPYFASVSVEVYPMSEAEYAALKHAGADGLTVYQEVYDRRIYAEVHPSGRKRDYAWRLDTPERGAKAGLRSVNIGCLFGLGEPRREAFLTALHARYLEQNHPQTEVGLSLPRINPAEGGFQPLHPVNDRLFVQILLAYRLFLPNAGIAMSTRESAETRDRLMPLGITRLSGGSMTCVGGYDRAEKNTPQFEISDSRSVEEMKAAVRSAGFDPVFKDWEWL